MSVRVAGAADKRFRRARVRPVRRRWLRRLLGWRTIAATVAAGAFLYSAYRAADVVRGASMFRVSRILVRGNSRLSTGEVLAMLAGLRHRSVFTVDLVQGRARLRESPWVEEAALRRILPSTVEVTVIERRPMGLCRIGSRLYLVDDGGTIIDEYSPLYSDLDLPILDGLVTVPREGRPLIDEARANLAGRLLASVNARPDLARRISQVDVRDVYDAVVMLDGDTALLHVGSERFAERLQSYIDLTPALRARVPDIDYVDLRFDDRVYVGPVQARQ